MMLNGTMTRLRATQYISESGQRVETHTRNGSSTRSKGDRKACRMRGDPAILNCTPADSTLPGRAPTGTPGGTRPRHALRSCCRRRCSTRRCGRRGQAARRRASSAALTSTPGRTAQGASATPPGPASSGSDAASATAAIRCCSSRISTSPYAVQRPSSARFSAAWSSLPAVAARTVTLLHASFVERIGESLVKVREVLVGPRHHALLPDPQPHSRSDRVEVSNDRLGPNADAGEVVGAAVRREHQPGPPHQRHEIGPPAPGRISHDDRISHRPMLHFIGFSGGRDGRKRRRNMPSRGLHRALRGSRPPTRFLHPGKAVGRVMRPVGERRRDPRPSGRSSSRRNARATARRFGRLRATQGCR